MIKFLKSLFKRKNAEAKADTKKTVFPPSIIDEESERYILDFCKRVAAILKIDLPEIRVYGLVFSSQGMVQCQTGNFNQATLPNNAEPHGGYFFDDKNVIVVSAVRPVLVKKGHGKSVSFHYKYVPATIAEHLFTFAHELRHSWQKKYHEEEYYQHNAIGMEIINDSAEVDADAFALAIVFSEGSPVKISDLPSHLQQIALQATMDNGKRWARAKELVKQYEFGKTSDIVKLKKQLEMKYANILEPYIKKKR